MTSYLSPDAFAGRTVVLVGGGTGMGLQVARQVVAAGGRVVLGGRTRATLERASADLGERATWHLVDTADAASVERLFEQVERVDGLFTTAASYVTGPMSELSLDDAATPFASKFWGQYRVVKAALGKLSADASIVLMSGAASVRPAGHAPAYVAANAAIEGLARGLAVELAPIRVNAVAPGTVDGHLWDQRDPAVRQAAFDFYRDASTIGRMATEPEIAQAVVFLLLNGVTTGSTIYPDGGYSLR